MTVTDRFSGSALRMLAVLGAMAMACALLPQPAHAQETGADPCADAPESGFTDRDDIPPAHQANVDCAADVNIVQGFQDGTFRPQLQVRRDQMASFIALTLDAAGVALPAGEDDTFTDVGEGNIHADNVNRLAAAGIVQGGPLGLPADEYGPALRTRRDQMASFLMRAAGYALHDDVDAFDSTDQQFSDVPAGNAHFAKVNGAAENGISQGIGGGRFGPGQETRRDQMASFVVRLLAFVLEDGDEVPGFAVGITLRTTTGPPGTNVDATVTGDVDAVESIAISGDCIEDGDVTLSDDAFAFDIDEGAAGGSCDITFTVTFEDDSIQVLRGTFGVVVENGPAVGITVTPTTGPGGTTVTARMSGDLDRVTTIAVAGDCVDDGEATLADNRFTFTIAAEAPDGECVITYTVTFDDGSTQVFTTTFVVADPAPVVGLTLAPTTGLRGTTVTATLSGDVDRVDSVAMTGVCVEDGEVTLTGNTFTFDIAADARAGICGLTFTVTYDSGATQLLAATFTVAPVQIELDPDPSEGLGGTEVTATVTGDIDSVTRITMAGACVENGEVTLADGTFTFDIAAAAPVGACNLTFRVTFDDESTQTSVRTFTVLAATNVAAWDVTLSWINEVDTPPGETPDIEDTNFRQGEEDATGQANLVIRERSDGTQQQLVFELDASAVSEPFCDGPGAHLHEGGLTENGPVRVFFANCTELDDNDGVVSGVLTDADFSGGVTIADVLADPENYYVNVHSDAFPAGAIRGQLPDGGQSLIPVP